MIPRQWLVSCHRKRASAEAHQSVSNPRAMPPMLPWRRPLWGWRRRRPSILARHGLERFGRQRIYAAVPWRAFPTLGVVLSSLRRRGPLSSRPAPATCPRHLLRSCRLLLESVSLVEPTAEPRVQ